MTLALATAEGWGTLKTEFGFGWIKLAEKGGWEEAPSCCASATSTKGVDPSWGRNLEGVFSGVTTSEASRFPKPLVVASLLLVFADGGLGGNLGGSGWEFLGGKFGFERLRPASPASTS